MAEYIDREALFEKVLEEHRFVFRIEDLLNNEIVYQTVYRDFTGFIKSIPAADVAEVRHGTWTECGLRNPQCSLCRGYNIEKSNYCPNCGAKMDGKDGAENDT